MRYRSMNVLLVFSLLSALSAGSALAQTWSRGYSTGGAALFSADGGLVMAGAADIDDTRNWDGTLTRLDADGDVLWSVAHGGTLDDRYSDLVSTSDGGYLAIGITCTDANCNERQLALTKFNSAGTVLWESAYDGDVPDGWPLNISPRFPSAVETSDGGFLVSVTGEYYFGGLKYASYVLRLNSTGTIVWQKYYALGTSVLAGPIHATPADGFVLPARLSFPPASTEDDNGVVFRADSSGVLQWTTELGGPEDDAFHSAVRTADGGFLVAGWTESYGAGRRDGWLVKLDASGNDSWQKTYGGAQEDVFRGIHALADGNFLLIGETESFGPNGEDGWVVKVDPGGNMIWDRTYGGFEYDRLASADESATGELVFDQSFNLFESPYSTWTLRLQSDGTFSSPCYLEGVGAAVIGSSSAIPSQPFVTIGDSAMTASSPGGTSIAHPVTYDEQCPCASCSPDAYENDDTCTSTKATIRGGETQSHNFWEDDTDWITFSACAGRSYTIETTNLGASTDTVLYVFDRDCIGPQLAVNDDFGGTLASRLVFNPPADGLYHIWVEQANHEGHLADLTYDISIAGDTSPCSTWARAYGGTGTDAAASVVESVEGQLVVAGTSDQFGFGGDDGWIFATDPEGVVLWNQTYWASTSGADTFVGIERLSDGQLVAGGSTAPIVGSCNLSAVWIDSAGTLLDEACFDSLPQPAGAVATDMDLRRDEITIVGNVLDQTTRFYAWGSRAPLRLEDGSAEHEILAVEHRTDGDYVFAGWIDTAASGERDTFIVVDDDPLRFRDQFVFSGPESGEAVAVAETADRGFVVLARRIVSGTPDQTDFWLLKFDRYAVLEWQRVYAGAALANEEPADVAVMRNGDLLIAGTTDETAGGDLDILLIRTDSSGQIIWQTRYGGALDDAVNEVRESTAGGILIAGLTQSFGAGGDDGWLLQLTSSGELLDTCSLDVPTTQTAWVIGFASGSPGVFPSFGSPWGANSTPGLFEETFSATRTDQCFTTCVDLDGDTWSDCAGDCDDDDASVYPGAPQLCDGINNDCSATSPLWPEVPSDEVDDDGDGFVECEPWVGGGGGGGGGGGAGGDGPDAVIGGGDCDDFEAHTYPDAPEWNDAKDNQCPGDAGYGLVDETTGDSGFHDPFNKSLYSWPAQPGATLYVAARSTSPTFSIACTTFTTSTPSWNDPTLPAAGTALYYLNRTLAPNEGSWGLKWPGVERVFTCGTESSCSNGADDDGDGSVDCADGDCDGVGSCEFGTEASCADAVDNDADGSTDCADSDCDGVSSCEFGTELTCNDAADNDADGSTDCADADCAASGFCPETDCANALDDDADGSTDCADSDCDGVSSCEFGTELTCNDAADNDADGSTDCADADCAASGFCPETDCANALDDDADGSTDCADSDCDGVGSCEFGTELTCNDAVDNDADGSTDCADADCAASGFCPESDCANALDDDADGSTDCADSDCDGVGSCEFGTELTCNDAADNDADGSTDCADPDCATSGSCPETDCANALDDDGDGSTDCADSDCDGIGTCEFGTELSCADAVDNDADGSTDCDDPDCATSGSCPETDCANALDDDGDGSTDCADSDCDGIGTCEFGTELSCKDALDNDADGSVDCDDTDCALTTSCFEADCANGLDDDGDGATDCADKDCNGVGSCEFQVEMTCDDLVDNDADGSTDCADDDCNASTACGHFTFDDTTADDIPDTALYDFFNGLTVSTTDFILFETITTSGAKAWCSERADWYRDTYLANYNTGAGIDSGTWNRWFRSPNTGGAWTGPDAFTHQNLYGYCGCGGGEPYDWCSEQGLMPGGDQLQIQPAHTWPCEACDGVDCPGTTTLTIRVKPTRLEACGF